MSAPGRVNLIGEHIDYNGLAVLPMAIQRRTTLLLRRRRDARFRFVNIDDRYGEREFSLASCDQPWPAGDWGNYLKAPVRELAAGLGGTPGLDVLVSGDVPAAAGLSSSSALVIAVGLGLAHLAGLDRRRAWLAERMAAAERFVGTASGGMDQAISLGARAGTACLIGFSPLRWTPIPIPDRWSFVVAHSLTAAEKSGAAREEYNARTAQCAAALREVRSLLNEELTYSQLVQRHPVGDLCRLATRLPDVLARRFRHVVSEAERVEEAVSAMGRRDLEGFGRLMDASHRSLRDDYEVSCDALDDLVAVGRRHGAVGARLTGAGFGGCAVMLTSRGRVEELLMGLDESFYGPRNELEEVAELRFAARAEGGAEIAPWSASPTAGGPREVAAAD